MYIASRDPKAPVVVSRNREERLTSRNLDHPLAAGVPNCNGRIRVEMKLRAVGELCHGLLAMRRLVGLWQPEEFTVAHPPQHRRGQQ